MIAGLNILYCLVLVASITLVESIDILSHRKLDCQGVQIKAISQIVSEPSHPCNQIKDAIQVLPTGSAPTTSAGQVDMFGRMHLINECMCNLVSRDILWKSLKSLDVEEMYEIMLDVMEERNFRRESRDSEVQWLSELDRESSVDPNGYQKLIREQIAIRLAGPQKSILDRQVRDRMTSFLLRVCGHLEQMFGPAYVYIKAAGELSGNPEVINSMTGQDENLFKILVAHKGCRVFERLTLPIR